MDCCVFLRFSFYPHFPHFNYFKCGTLLKEAGTEHWNVAGGTDLTGFGGFGGGYRAADGLSFNDLQQAGIWWSSASLESVGAVFRLSATSSELGFNSGDNNSVGYSVRILRED